MESTAARQPSIEVIDAGELDVRRGGLVVVTIFIEPRDRVRTCPTVGRFMILRNGRGTAQGHGLGVQRGPRQLHA